jgi:hypothetical protein
VCKLRWDYGMVTEISEGAPLPGLSASGCFSATIEFSQDRISETEDWGRFDSGDLFSRRRFFIFMKTACPGVLMLLPVDGPGYRRKIRRDS